MKLMSAKNQFQGNHPKFAAFLKYVFQNEIPEGSVIEITVTKPGQDPVTGNLKVMKEDLELFESLKDMT
ncbi:MAG: hypothetical protein E7282_03900 [Lachnospiraceae bacterium]|nr:hypothetical protein [Lachnospiraceae bacterium]